MNKDKSNIYFNGVQRAPKEQIISMSGCVEGQLPFKYLGVPINAGRLDKKECQVLVEKIIDRIRSFGTRKVSYDGRLILVKSVLTSLFGYWANIFLIPKGVLKRIDSICRNYLWDGTSNYMRSPLVSWDQVCTPTAEGGLGIRNSFSWNTSTIGKLVWWIYSKPDSLWVKWIHQIYMKGDSWDNHLPKNHMSWGWNVVYRVRDVMKSGYRDGVWLADQKGYSVTYGYNWIRHKEQKVGWAKTLWHNWALPKHRFLCWLILKKALNVKDRIFKYGVCLDDLCCICNSDKETMEHVFQNCRYIKMVLEAICGWLHIPVPTGNGLIWLGRRKWSPVKKQVVIVAVMAAHYQVWQQRNSTRLEGVIQRPVRIVSSIQSLVRSKIDQHKLDVIHVRDRDWINSIK